MLGMQRSLQARGRSGTCKERVGRKNSRKSLKLQCNSEKISTWPKALSKNHSLEESHIGRSGQHNHLCCAQSLLGAAQGLKGSS